MRRVDKAPVVFFILLVLLAIFVFPPGSPDAASYYLSVAFLILAAAASTKGKGISGSIDYLKLSAKKSEIPSLIIWGVAVAVAALLLTEAISIALGWLGLYDAQLVTSKVLSFPLSLLVLAFTIVPICEEAFFRGYVFRQATEILSKFALPLPAWYFSAVFSSLLFAATHILYGSKAELIVTFFIGILFCAIAQKKNSLVPSIVAHAFYNLFSIVLMVFF